MHKLVVSLVPFPSSREFVKTYAIVMLHRVGALGKQIFSVQHTERVQGLKYIQANILSTSLCMIMLHCDSSLLLPV